MLCACYDRSLACFRHVQKVNRYLVLKTNEMLVAGKLVYLKRAWNSVERVVIRK